MNVRFAAFGLLALASLAAGPAHGQHRADAAPTRWEAAAPSRLAPLPAALPEPAAAPFAQAEHARPGAPTANLVLGGLLGGVAGFAGGAFVGAMLYPGDNEYFPEGAAIGALVGESLMLPLGVHLANGRRGSLWPSALASVGITGAGILLVPATGGLSLLAVPVAQLAVAIRTERAQ